MNKNIKHLFKLLFVTLLTILLSNFVIFIPLNFAVFSSTKQKIDQFDIFSDLMQKSGVKPFDNEIIVVTVPQNAGRIELSEALNMLSECNPAAIAVDVYLKGEADEFIDNMLIDAINNNTNIVFPAIYDSEKEINDSSLLEIKDCKVAKGFVNLDNALSPYTHSFNAYKKVGNDTVYNLTIEAIRLTKPEIIENLKKRDNKEELINFMMDIPSISYEDIPYMTDMISGRIVILGVSTNANYNNAGNERISNLMVHAFAASTIVHENYINKPDKWFTTMIALVLLLIFININFFLAKTFKNVGSFFIRLFTYSLFFFLAIGSYLLFVKHAVYINCEQLLIAIAFAPWGQDLYKVINVMYIHSSDKCKQIINYLKKK